MKKMSALFAVAALGGLTVSAHEGHAHVAPEQVVQAMLPAETSAVKMGEGAWQFETVPGWCESPKGPYYGSTHGGIGVARDGTVFISREGDDHAITVHDGQGKLLRTIPGYGGIHDLKVVQEGDQEFLYGAYLKGQQVIKLTLEGELVWAFDREQLVEKGVWVGKKFAVTAVAVGPDGRVYVCDGYASSQVHVLDKNGQYLSTFGGKGTGEGKFKTSHGITVDMRSGEPTLLVADRENRRLQRFDMDGKFMEVVATDLRRPCAFSFHGEYLAVAELHGRVVILDGDNQVVCELGTNDDKSQAAQKGVPPEKWQEGVFTAPHGLSFDHDGNLIVMDWNRFGRITFLKKVPAEH